MIRTVLTWVIVGAVVAVLAVGGVDALRSSEGETNPSSTTGSATMSEESVGELPRCKREQIKVAMEVLGGYAATVVQNASTNACHLRLLPIRVKLTDQAGRIMNFGLPPEEGFGGDFLPGVQQTSRIEYIEDCQLRGPVLVVVTVGPYRARRSGLTASEVGCGRAV